MTDRKPTEVQTVILSKEKFKNAEAAKKWLRAHDFKSELDETEDSYRARQKDPGDFTQGSFRTISVEDGVSAVVGHKKGDAKGLVRTGVMAWAPQAFMLDMFMLEPPAFDAPFRTEGAAAIVDIRGVLTHHSENPCLDSYDAIKERMFAALHSEAACVIMRVDSLGGDVAGCFDLATWIRAEATACGKRLLAYTDGTAASAAYAIACVADEIGVGITGFVGSVGIINALLDQTAHDAAQGLRYEFATSGARKADGNPHTPITEEARDALQAQVDALAGVFYDHVAKHRKIPAASVAALQASLFFGESAVSRRLADRVCSWGEMVSLATNPPETKDPTMPKYLEEARKMAAKMVEDGDDGDREMAKKMMALFGDDKPKEEAKAEEEAPASKKPEAKAEAEEEPKAKAAYGEGERESEKMKAAAAAAAPGMFDVLKELHSIKAEREAEKTQAERSRLLATRPDFDAKTKAWLEDAPLATVRNAVANFPRIPVNPAAASQVKGTAGSHEGGYPSASAREGDLDRPPSMTEWIKQKMGREDRPKAGIVHAGRDLVFMPMTQAEAAAALAKKGA